MHFSCGENCVKTLKVEWKVGLELKLFNMKKAFPEFAKNYRIAKKVKMAYYDITKFQNPKLG